MLAINATTHCQRFHLTVTESGAESIGLSDLGPGFYPPAEGSGDAPFVVVDVRSDEEPTAWRIRQIYAATFLSPCPV